MTKQLLWQEYRQQHPDDGYSYAQFCHRYLEWLGKQKRSMRQIHRAGEKLFVAVLGASNYTFARASWSQNQADWLGAHVLAFEFFGGVPELVVCPRGR